MKILPDNIGPWMPPTKQEVIDVYARMEEKSNPDSKSHDFFDSDDFILTAVIFKEINDQPHYFVTFHDAHLDIYVYIHLIETDKSGLFCVNFDKSQTLENSQSLLPE